MSVRSRRRVLSAIGVSLLTVGGGCTDSPLERTTIRVANRDDRERRVTVWVAAGDDLTVDETIAVPPGAERALSTTLDAPLRSRRYRVTVQVGGGEASGGGRTRPAFAASFSFDEGFDSLWIAVEADGGVSVEPADGV